MTGKHYNNWKLRQYLIDNYEKAKKCLLVCLYKESEIEEIEEKHKLSVSLNGYYFKTVNGVLYFYYNGKLVKKQDLRDVTDHYTGICNAGFFETNGKIGFDVVFFDDTTFGEFNGRHFFVDFVYNKWLYFKMKVVNFLNDYVLQILHCIPTYTEIDALKRGCPGWYKRFGKQLLEDMKKQLKKDKMLYSFRITQIKEKWGRFCLYCGPASMEMYSLLGKYEALSEEVCIDCGEDADIITSPYGWQCPYCNSCYEKNHSNEMIGWKKNENGVWEEIDYKM
jgi:hypothetical protein